MPTSHTDYPTRLASMLPDPNDYPIHPAYWPAHPFATTRPTPTSLHPFFSTPAPTPPDYPFPVCPAPPPHFPTCQHHSHRSCPARLIPD
jgi:hypothetical protein